MDVLSTLHDDEVVADSEDEENPFGLQILQMNPDMSFVQTTFPDITNNIRPSGISEINSFTDKPSAPFTSILPVSSSSSRGRPSSPVTILKDTISSSSISGPAPRPKPRPAYKKKDKAENIDGSSNNLSPQVHATGTSNFSESNMDMPSSIADRAKMRSRKTKINAANAIHTVTPTRCRNSNMTVPSNDVIELSSDEDELALLPPPKSKSKGKGKGKANTNSRAMVSSDSPLSSAPESDSKPKSKVNKRSKTAHPISPHQSTSQGTTASLHDHIIPIPFHLLSSQLPPSDPPVSTATTCDLPPIETLQNLDTDPLSSPSSLFSPLTSARRKRKRVILGVDELDSDDPQGPGIEMDVDIRKMPPPPLPRLPLARPSSSFVDTSPHATPNHSAGIVDLSMIPSTADTNVDSIGPVKKSKIAKPRKKKGEKDLTENGEAGKAKPKGKGKAKIQKKKVEVVIQLPKGKAKEKEVFKSREFIEEDEEDEGLVVETSSRKKATFNKPSSMTSLSSLPGSDGEDMQVGPSKKRKSSGDGTKHSAKDMLPTDEEDEPAPKRATGKAKRHSKVLSEDEDDGPATISSLKEVSPDRPSTVNGLDKGKRRAMKTSSSVPGGSEKRTKDSYNTDVDAMGPQAALKENIQAVLNSETSTKPTKPSESLFPSLSSRYTIASKAKPTPMSDLIRRVNSLPGSPFPTPQPRVSRLSTTGTAYSPYLKSSRSMLSRIAPLHPNRRTPPPPLPPPPPPKKTKKEKEREEQWEEELIESVGGITEWACMTDAERKEMRQFKRQREMAGWEE